MHTLFFKSIAGSLAALALGVSVATTPASAHGGRRRRSLPWRLRRRRPSMAASADGGFHGGFGDRGFRAGFRDRGFLGGFGALLRRLWLLRLRLLGYYGYGNCLPY